MTAIRGPLPEPLPVQPIQFSDQEIEALLLVKPTPYMDEPDLSDPTWVLPVAPIQKPDLYAEVYERWRRAMFGEGENR